MIKDYNELLKLSKEKTEREKLSEKIREMKNKKRRNFVIKRVKQLDKIHNILESPNVLEIKHPPYGRTEWRTDNHCPKCGSKILCEIEEKRFLCQDNHYIYYSCKCGWEYGYKDDYAKYPATMGL